MPVPEEKLYKHGRLHKWFAVSSVLMTVSIVWMIWVDYDRPWREVQNNYYLARAGFAHLDFLDASRDERANELAEAERRLADQRDYDSKVNGPRRAEMLAELERVDLSFRKVNAPFGQLSQILQVTQDAYERTLGEFGPEHPRTKAAHAELQEQRDRLANLQKDKEHWEDEKRRIERELKGLDEEVKKAEKRYRDLKQVLDSAAEKDRQFRGVLKDEGLLAGLPVVRALINMPLLDFTAPKNTPSRHQVNQLVLPQVRQQLNYLETYTTDRCTTCHVSIAEPEFSKDRLAVKLETSLPGINEELQRRKLQPLDFPPLPVLEGKDMPQLTAGQVTAHWHLLSRQQQDEYFNGLLSRVNAYFKQTGRKTIELSQPLLAHPNLDLYVSVDSPHSMAKVGCTVCHEGNPQETDFVLASHSPATHKIQEEWEEKYYLRLLGIPNVTFETVSHYWDRPMFLPRHTEASCSKCHTQVTDLGRFEGQRTAAKIEQGQHLFLTLGCVNCHEDKPLAGARKVGPELAYISSKLTPAFAQQWAFFPQKFRPSTRMPHLFMQENNGPGSENAFDPDPVARTETEVAAMVKYLFAVSRPWEPIKPPADVHGDAERGRALLNEVGCLACHSVVAEHGEAWIAADIAKKKGVDAETAQYQYRGMSYIERVRYAMENFPSEQDSFLRPETARLDVDRGQVPHVFTRFAPELSGIGSKVTAEWLYSWLIEPTHYWSETKMPSLRLTPAEAADLTAYLMTLKNDRFEQKEFDLSGKRKPIVENLLMSILTTQRSERASREILADARGELTEMVVALLEKSLGRQPAYDLVRPMSIDDKRLMFLGNKMIAHYGCYACHKIIGFEETTPPGTELTKWSEKPISQLDFAFFDHAFHHMRESKKEIFGSVYLPDATELNEWAPGPNPPEQITHTHAAFAKHKMLNPRIWDREKIKKPYDKLKMPNFYLTDAEAEALTVYLLSRRSPRVDEQIMVDYEGSTSGPIAEGRKLTRELNCVGCHEIEDNAPTIQQYFRRTVGGRLMFDALNAPPLLWGQGAKVQHDWLHTFFNQVEPLRPWLNVRMPSFKLSNEESTILTEYFAALSRADAVFLTKTMAPVKESAKGGEPAGTNGAEPGAAENKWFARVANDWFSKDLFRRAADRLRRFAMERKLMRPLEFDGLRADADQLAAAHRKLLERADFIRGLYDVPFPFVEPPKPLSSSDRYATGEQLFNAMGCLKCHVMGNMVPGPARTTDEFVQVYRLDGVRGQGEQAVAMLNGQPYPVGSVVDGHRIVSAENVYYESGDIETKAVVEGPNASGETERVVLAAPSAPNLGLTYKRLRRDWVYHWMLQPGWIQPGTKMPQNFPGGKSPFEGDPKFPGTGLDHVNLLVDFMYDAGAKGYRAPLVKSVTSAKAEEFDEEGGAKKEEVFED